MNAPFSIAPQKLLPVEWPKGICHQVPYAVFSSKEIYDVEQEKYSVDQRGIMLD